MSEQQQKEEIERIFKEIYNKYKLDITGLSLYYKNRNESVDMLDFLKVEYEQAKKILFNPQLEYALYISFRLTIAPSSNCLNKRKYLEAYHDAVSQFVPILDRYSVLPRRFVEDALGVVYMASLKDPLSQIFAYKHILATKWPEHVYVCQAMYIVKPYDPDPTSVFHGKYGLIAYCTTIRGIILTYENGNTMYAEYLRMIYSIFRKLDPDNKELSKLRRRDKLKACDIDFIKSIVHDEIEEIKSIMKRYGFIRITLTLD